MRVATAAALAVCTLIAGCLPPPGSGSDEPPTPTPTPNFRDEARSICRENARAIRGLLDRLAGEVTAANLVEQGTIVAGLAGVISTELVQLRAIQVDPAPADREAVSAWFDELDATADAQVRAVSASAGRNVSAFRTAVASAFEHWDAASAHALAIGLRSCRPAGLGPPA